MGRWLTIKDKRALIAKAGENPGMTHAELAEWSTKTYNLGRPLARSTVSDILRKAPQTMSPAHEDTSRRKLVKVTSIRLEKALWAWIALQETRNIVLSRELIAMKARVSEAAVTRKKSSESCDVDIHEVVANTSAMRI
ncbi:hypothetical protein PPTG_22757 [Phytophthora nicotianae INRA-310]|uniref:HTH CENPB-type domain-containing protein n=2 Tax=Phytophthora nicotianae TaxID=4792 RepID=W2QCA3_PHYN3|nr:hypothetical protein PPTG_22757 [Phytophthora nicotianae INRA-310]ETN10506.1 hypothetical protein PPTG_22757 [Phytophthora nicotianae INRA-310]ETO77121.1 hypothetical protein F444_07641 [Phytophthora nicotianae P1976]